MGGQLHQHRNNLKALELYEPFKFLLLETEKQWRLATATGDDAGSKINTLVKYGGGTKLELYNQVCFDFCHFTSIKWTICTLWLWQKARCVWGPVKLAHGLIWGRRSYHRFLRRSVKHTRKVHGILAAFEAETACHCASLKGGIFGFGGCVLET